MLLTLIVRKEGTDAMFLAKRIDIDAYITFITENKEMLYRVAFGYLRDETKALNLKNLCIYQKVMR